MLHIYIYKHTQGQRIPFYKSKSRSTNITNMRCEKFVISFTVPII